MMGHTSWILDIISDERFIYSCSDDKTVKVWDLNTRKKLTSYFKNTPLNSHFLAEAPLLKLTKV